MSSLFGSFSILSTKEETRYSQALPLPSVYYPFAVIIRLG
jgi:hypothetical protein